MNEVGVQLILLVEDGIRFYSSILPNLYKFVLKQSQEFSTEALNAHQRTLRMRGRPKIVLARTYEEAITIYQQYNNNVLGVITDVRFPKDGSKDSLAGIKLCAEIRNQDPFVPLIIQSSEIENTAYAAKYGAAFIDKNSKKMDVDLRRAVSENFGFGDFVFRNPDTLEEIARVKNLIELQNIIFAVPAESFLYHISRNHISRWLYSRAMFPVAEFLKPITCLYFIIENRLAAAILPQIYLLPHIITWQRMVKIKNGKKLNSILGETSRNMLLMGFLLSIGLILSTL